MAGNTIVERQRLPDGGTGGGKTKRVLTVNVAAGKLGGAANGTSWPAGTETDQILEDIFTEVTHPSYNTPAASLNGNPAPGTWEVGTPLSIVFQGIFIQNDGGAITGIYLLKNSVQQAVNFPVTDIIVLSPSSVSYLSYYTYSQGAIKNNNLGQPDPIGQIPAGGVSSGALTYRGWYRMFWDATAAPSTSAQVRSAGNSRFTNTGGDWIFNTGISSLYFWFWIPTGVTLVEVIDLDAFNAPISFTGTPFNVEDAAGNPVTGTLYTLSILAAYSSNHRYKITVS